MYEKYIAKRLEAKEKFNRIIQHSNMLRCSNPDYMNSLYNLEIEWDNSTTSWEPLSGIIKDNPVSCAIYGLDNILLESNGWMRLNHYIDNDTGKPKGTPTLHACHNVDRFMSETTFKMLVQTLAKDEEMIDRAVDYVKGVLIPDQIDTLQCIINDCIYDVSEQKLLRKYLKIVGNYLKHQHKAKIHEGDILFGLSIANDDHKALHYSTMNVAQLRRMCNERGLHGSINRMGKDRLIEKLEMNDEELGDSNNVITVDSTDERSNAENSNNTSAGLKFLHWFMYFKLPDCLNKELDGEDDDDDDNNDREDNDKKERIINAINFTADAHIKFILFMGHNIRGTNQQRALNNKERK